MKQKKHIKSLLKRTTGASLAEYSLAVGLIAVTSVGAVFATGTTVEDIFCKTNDSIRYAIFGTEPECLTTAEMDDRGLWFGNLNGSAGEQEDEEDVSPPSLSLELGEDSWGVVDITVPMPGGGFPGPGPHTVRVTPGDGTPETIRVGACSGTENDMSCSSQSSGVSTKTMDEDDTEFGYSVSLPEDPRVGYSQDVLIEVVDANGQVVYSSEETVTKPAAEEIYAGIDENLGHWDIPAGTTGEYFLFAPVHNFNTPFTIVKAETGNGLGTGKVCLLTVDEEEECDWSGVTIVPGEDVALGVSLALPSDTRLDADFTVALTMTSTVDPSVVYNLTATASREPEPNLLSVSGTLFTDELIPMGTTGNYYVKEELNGTFSGPMFFEGNVSAAKNHTYIRLCYWADDTELPSSCDIVSTGIMVPKDAHSIGYAIQPVHSDVNKEMYVTFSDFSLSSDIDRNLRHDWTDTVTAERPQWEPQVATRNSCDAHYDAGERTNGYFPISAGGDDMRLYCTFVDSGDLEGGWTTVSFNKDTNPTSWDSGVNAGFHARSSTESLTSYSLSAGQIPTHGTIAFGTHNGSSATIYDAFNLNWNPSAIWNYSNSTMQNPGAVAPAGKVTSIVTGNDAAIVKLDEHAPRANYNGNQDPINYTGSYNGLLSVSYGTVSPRWAFVPGQSNPKIRGYALGGFQASRTENYAFTIMVR